MTKRGNPPADELGAIPAAAWENNPRWVIYLGWRPNHPEMQMSCKSSRAWIWGEEWDGRLLPLHVTELSRNHNL